MSAARTSSLAIFLAASGCSAVLNFNECKVSADCSSKQGSGPVLFCNSDHQCVDTTPCAIETSPTATSTGTPLVIAGLYQLTVKGGTDDHAIHNAASLAAYEITNKMYPVTHVVCDTHSDPATAQKALKIAVEQFHASAIIGPDTSDEYNALAPLVTKYGVVMMSPSATSVGIGAYHQPDQGLTWRTCGDDGLQARVLAGLVPKGALDIVWVSANDYADGLEKQFVMASGRSDATTIMFPRGNITGVVPQMGTPVSALLIVDDDAQALVAALHTAPGQSATQYYMTDSAKAPTLWGNAPYDYTFLARISGTGPAVPPTGDPSRPVYDAFVSGYTSYFKEDPGNTSFVANAYDAFYVLAIAAFAAVDPQSGLTATGAQIASNLSRVSATGAAQYKIGPDTLQAAVNDLRNGNPIDIVGASGALDFDATTGNVITAPIEQWTIAQSGTMPAFKTVKVVTP